jgi:hypothetical protein
MDYVVKQFRSLQTPELKKQLSNLAFVPSGPLRSRLDPGAESKESKEQDGTRVCANQLFDPRHALLSELFGDDSVFPGAEFAGDNKRLDFLVQLGLRNKLTPAVIVECAKRLEATSLTSLDELRNATDPAASERLTEREASLFEAARKLVTYIWAHFTELSSPYFWRQIEEVSFVPVRFQDRQVLSRYRALTVWSDRHLSWTVTPVVPEALSPPTICHERLGIKSPPASGVVFAHLRRITKLQLDTWDSTVNRRSSFAVGSPLAVFRDIFNYLEIAWEGSTWETLDDVQWRVLIAELRSMPLVPLGNRLLKASRLYFRLDQDLAPFVFEVPRMFGAFDALFRRLGTKQTPERQDYVQFLQVL